MRQRDVRQDNTMDRAGTLPLNLYESSISLSPLDLQVVFAQGPNLTSVDTEMERHEGDLSDRPEETI